MKRGQQTTYSAHSGRHHAIHLIGALDWQTHDVHTLSVAQKNGDTFIQFLEHLCLQVLPQHPLVLVLDNVSYHRSTPVMALLNLLQPRVQVVWLPAYSPDMNPIERFWLFLKQQVYANRLFPSLAHLLQHIQLWIDIQSLPDHPNRLSFARYFR